MPEFTKVSHTSFSVRDADASARWLEQVMGFEPLDKVEGQGWRGVLLLHQPSATVLEFQQHDANPGDRFDPRRSGLDHVGFLVGTRAALDEWQEHFSRLGVDHTPVVDRDYGSVLTFRGPDGIQLEMFCREGHP